MAKNAEEQKGRPLVGRLIKRIRWLTKKEVAAQGWPREKVVALELDDGTLIFASSDAEGNSSGELFGADKNGDFYVTVGK